MPPRVTQLESERAAIVGTSARTHRRARPAGRHASRSSKADIDDMTGAIKRQAAVTAAPRPRCKSGAAGPERAGHDCALSRAQFFRSAAAQFRSIRLPPHRLKPNANTAAVPMPPTRVAAVAANEPAPPANTQNEFGLDLGGAATLDGVRQRWITVKASFGPLLSGMYPLAAHERRAGASGYRLVVGPLPNSPAATGLCAPFCGRPHRLQIRQIRRRADRAALIVAAPARRHTALMKCFCRARARPIGFWSSAFVRSATRSTCATLRSSSRPSGLPVRPD